MTDRIDGGPAFPIPYHPDQNWQNPEGMTLRDWFAGMALQGLVTIPDIRVPKHLTYRGLITKYAYELADGMLQEREAVE